MFPDSSTWYIKLLWSSTIQYLEIAHKMSPKVKVHNAKTGTRLKTWQLSTSTIIFSFYQIVETYYKQNLDHFYGSLFFLTFIPFLRY